jgi:parallel beta-helix repeat protein
MVRYNNIHHVVTLLEDGAGIYTLSKQPGSFISDNYIHDIRGSPWRGFDAPVAGIYLDEGSSSITVQNNVVENVDLGLYLQSHGMTAADNIIVNYIYDVVGNISGNFFLSDSSFFPSSVRDILELNLHIKTSSVGAQLPSGQSGAEVRSQLGVP